MYIIDLINDLKTWNEIPVDETKTCDTVKAGSVDKEVHKVAIAMFGTIDVIRQVKDWGAELLIVHEPLYYDHMDNLFGFTVAAEKQRIIAESGLTIFRYHDYGHAMNPDMICAGEIKYAGLEGELKERVRKGITSFVLKEPLTAKELAEKLAENLNLDQIRISGCIDKKGDRIACCFGSPGELHDLYETHDYILAGEICEWRDAEMARDAAALGCNKAIFALGHETSERAGMMYMRDLCVTAYPDLEFKYFESESVVTKS